MQVKRVQKYAFIIAEKNYLASPLQVIIVQTFHGHFPESFIIINKKHTANEKLLIWNFHSSNLIVHSKRLKSQHKV